jgi:hypothetical protein
MCRLVLPAEYRLKDIGFYGDDGRSSLFSDEDTGSGREGRQGLGLLVERFVTDKVHTELWLLKYDDLCFQPIDLTQSRCGPRMSSIFDANVEDICSVQVHPTQQDETGENMDNDSNLLARCK